MGGVQGMTIALNAGDAAAVLDFYTRVFTRGPDTAPMDDFLEWQICPGTWLQLSTGHERPGANNARVRFEVEELGEAVIRMRDAEVPMGEVVAVPGVVAFSNFSDHWGNALGFYQMLSPRNLVAEAERRRHERERQEEWQHAPADLPADLLAGDGGVGRGGHRGGGSEGQSGSERSVEGFREGFEADRRSQSADAPNPAAERSGRIEPANP